MKTTRRAITLILISSLLAGSGQILWKKASFNLSLNILSLLNPFLITGILLYTLATFAMILSFREGELSVLHPFLATSYVWVTLISHLFIPTETITINKFIGVLAIFIGVSLIGIGSKHAN